MSRVPALVLEHLGMSYRVRGRDVSVFSDLSLRVERGQVAALVGPNGSGKTTALRIIATLLRPSAGRALVFGRDVVTEPSAVRSRVGVSLGTGRSFYWRLSALHNLAFFARLEGVRARSVVPESRRLAAELDLERWLPRPARTLSRGALARLSVARACLGEPGLLLLDEPFASVDDRGRNLVWRAVERRVAVGRSVVLATHDRSLASRCGVVVEVDA